MSYTEQCARVLDSGLAAGPASDQAIREAEEALGVVFPKTYRAFLARYGAVMGNGFEIAGLFVSDDAAPPMWCDIVEGTKQTRRAVGGRLPQALLPISGDGMDQTYYIDAVGGDDCPVIAYGPGCDGEQIAGSFDEFVVKLASGAL